MSLKTVEKALEVLEKSLNFTPTCLNEPCNVCHNFNYSRYKIYNNPDERTYAMTAKLKLCFQGDNCELLHTILDNATIPYPICKLDAGFLDPGEIVVLIHILTLCLHGNFTYFFVVC